MAAELDVVTSPLTAEEDGGDVMCTPVDPRCSIDDAVVEFSLTIGICVTGLTMAHEPKHVIGQAVIKAASPAAL